MATEVGDFSRLTLLKHHHAVTLLQSQAEACQQAILVLLGDSKLVGLYFDAVELVAVELHPVGDLAQLTIDTDGEEAFLAELLKELLIVSFALLDNRG